MVYKFFDKKSTGGGIVNSTNNNNNINNNDIKQNRYNQLKNYINQLLENFEKEKFRDNIWGADLADMQLISKFKIQILFMCY